MKSQSLKIFIACALGAGIGSLIALEVNQYLWWIGLIIGGLTGYLSYEFKAVINAIQQTWLKVVGYKPNKDKIIRNLLRAIVAFITFINIAICMFIAFQGVLLPWYTFFMLTHIISVCVVFSFLFVFTLFRILAISEEQEDERKFAVQKNIIFLMNPVMLFIYWPIWWLWKLAPAIFKYIPSIPQRLLKPLSKIALFFKTVFILIHSDIRLLCGIDAAIGAGIGYLTGSIIIGMLIGGILGVINYEMVSKRWLKLVNNS